MSLCPEVVPIDVMQCVSRSRVLYADTDKMGIVYHATYLRYLELGRVELLRAAGLSYARMEADGFEMKVFSEPNIAVTPKGTIWVTVPAQRIIRAYSPEGEQLAEFVGQEKSGRFGRAM